MKVSRNMQRKVEMKIYHAIALEQMKRTPQTETAKLTDGKTAGDSTPK